MVYFGDLESYGKSFYDEYGYTKAYASLIKGVDGSEYFDVDLKTMLDNFIWSIFEDEESDMDNYVYFHNGGGFDYHFMLDMLMKYGDESKITVNYLVEENKNILYFNLKYKNKRQTTINGKKTRKKWTKNIYFRDSYRVWPMSLKAIGKSVGLPKIDDYNYDMTELFEDNASYMKHNDGKTWEYLERDVDILIKFYEQTKDLVDITKAGLTSASIAIKDGVSRNESLKHYKYWMGDKESWDVVNEGYIGGFTWVNPLHQLKRVEKIYKYDVNSLYPAVMRSNKFPYGKGVSYQMYLKKRKEINAKGEADTPSEFEKSLRKDMTYRVYRCKAKSVKAKSIPFYPFRVNKYVRELAPDMAQYPEYRENVEWVCNNYMLDFLKEWYEIEELETEFVIAFEERTDLHKDFVDHWMVEKIKYDKSGDGAKRQMTKTISNSYYGKWGMNPQRISCNIVKKEDIINSELYVKRPVLEFYDGHRIEPMNDDYYFVPTNNELDYYNDKITNEEKLRSSFIPIADKVTTLARIHLLKEALHYPDKMVYFDTDSIHSLIPMDDILWIDSSEYGAWKYEGLVEVGVYRRAKHYLNTNVTLPDGEIEEYCLKGGGINVKRLNETRDVSIEDYLQPEFTIKNGKTNKKRVKGGIILYEVDVNVGMPKTYKSK